MCQLLLYSIFLADEIEILDQADVGNQGQQSELNKRFLTEEEKHDGAKAIFTKGSKDESDQAEVIYQNPGNF